MSKLAAVRGSRHSDFDSLAVLWPATELGEFFTSLLPLSQQVVSEITSANKSRRPLRVLLPLPGWVLSVKTPAAGRSDRVY